MTSGDFSNPSAMRRWTIPSRSEVKSTTIWFSPPVRSAVLKNISLDSDERKISSYTFHARGHRAVLSTHRSTIEVTKESHLSTKGDCIVAVDSSIGPLEFPPELKSALSNQDTIVELVIAVGNYEFIVRGKGDPRLTLAHPTDLVARRSGFVSERTIMVHADKAAMDLPRKMVQLLQDPEQTVSINITASRQS